ncbi:hypothetical protein N9A28_07375 [Sulfurimonas sp.]|nr:hypothetical protein [Sulfurimonas sp.]
MKIILLIISILVAFSGCQKTNVQAPKKVIVLEPKEQVDMSSLFEAEKEEEDDSLYFQGSKGKVYDASTSSSQLKWLRVRVPHTNSRNGTTFKVMSRVVTKKEFLGSGSTKEPMTNISYEAANNFCSVKFDGAVLSTPYVFEHARRNSLLKKPKNKDFIEMVAPVDYEDFDDTFKRKGDKLESSDEDVSTMIIFRWDTQKYYTISLSYKSSDMGFRCYK